MSVQNFSLLAYHEVAEKFRGDVSNLNPSCIELELGLSYDNFLLVSPLSIIISPASAVSATLLSVMSFTSACLSAEQIRLIHCKQIIIRAHTQGQWDRGQTQIYNRLELN